jgi:GAF domain-containing protein
MRIGDPVVGECAERREAVQVPDPTKEDPTRSPLIGILMRSGIRVLLAVPLLYQGEVLGALVVRRGRGIANFEPLGALTLKGFHSPVRAHNLVSLR